MPEVRSLRELKTLGVAEPRGETLVDPVGSLAALASPLSNGDWATGMPSVVAPPTGVIMARCVSKAFPMSACEASGEALAVRAAVSMALAIAGWNASLGPGSKGDGSEVTPDESNARPVMGVTGIPTGDCWPMGARLLRSMAPGSDCAVSVEAEAGEAKDRL